MADDIGMEAEQGLLQHRLVIRTVDPITVEQKRAFQASVQDLLDLYEATFIDGEPR